MQLRAPRRMCLCNQSDRKLIVKVNNIGNHLFSVPMTIATPKFVRIVLSLPMKTLRFSANFAPYRR